MREMIQATSPSIARKYVFPVRVAPLSRLPPLCLFPGQSGSQPTRWFCNSFFVWPLLTELTEQLIGMTSQLRIPYPPASSRNGEKEQGAAAVIPGVKGIHLRPELVLQVIGPVSILLVIVG